MNWESSFAELIYGILAVITLLLGAVLTVLIYIAYTRVKERTLLYFNLGLFILVIGLIFTDLSNFAGVSDKIVFWTAVCSRILEITGIGIMIIAVIR